MIIDNINLNHIRIFESVYRSKSMTRAAEELHMTQSGVSQHIKLLEEMLDVKLFDRIKQRLVPTQQANTLYRRCSKGLIEIEQALIDIKGKSENLLGNVALGLPVEFGNNVVVPLLVKFGKTHADVTYTIKYGLTSDISTHLIKGELDFAFVDDFAIDRSIETVNVFEEKLCLCASFEYLQRFPNFVENKKFFESLNYIDYDKDGSILTNWFKHHYRSQNIKYKIRAVMVDVQGVAKMITEGLGAGILPYHFIERLQMQGHRLFVFEGSGKILTNIIRMAYVKDRTRPKPAQFLMDFLVNSLGR